MDAITDPAIHSIVVMKSAQVGWTEIINNAVGYFIDQDPCPLLLIQPTLDMAKAYSKDRLAPMLRDSPALKGKVRDAKSRESDNTVLHKVFPGGHITMAGANSPASLASRPIRVVLCDEVDRYPSSAGTEGDPISLARKRSTTFWNRLLLMGSTPTVKDASRIEAGFEASDQRRFYVPCPHCDEPQVLKWAQVQWPKGHPEDAYYVCEHCGAIINDADKHDMLVMGEWRAESDSAGVAGFHVNEIYSPWVTFAEMALSFVEAKKLPETLQTWVNTSLGETFEEQGEKVDEDKLLARREEYEQAPADVLVVTMAADVQADRLEAEIVGWGEGEESFGLGYYVLWGDPTEADVWEDLDDLINTPIEREDGVSLSIKSTLIDSGYLTDYVYDFVMPRQGRRVYATKGMEESGRPIISAPAKKKAPRGSKQIQLFTIGTDEAKGVIFSRLKLTEPGPGYCHFPTSYDEEYFRQLTAEKAVIKKTRGFPKRVWVKMRPRNEAIDIRVLNLAALKLLNPNWAALKNKQHAETPQPEQSTPAQQMIQQRKRPAKRRGGFVNRWRH